MLSTLKIPLMAIGSHLPVTALLKEPSEFPSPSSLLHELKRPVMIIATKSNLEIALNACVETLSLSDFIRIAFLKSQFSRLSWNIENSDIDFPTLLLNAGETANSLRSVWDGDFENPCSIILCGSRFPVFK